MKRRAVQSLKRRTGENDSTRAALQEGRFLALSTSILATGIAHHCTEEGGVDGAEVGHYEGYETVNESRGQVR